MLISNVPLTPKATIVRTNKGKKKKKRFSRKIRIFVKKKKMFTENDNAQQREKCAKVNFTQRAENLFKF